MRTLARILITAIAFFAPVSVARAQSHPDDIYWDTRFDALGASSRVEAIVIDGANVFVTGAFTSIGGVPAHEIARWDGTQWHALGGGISGFCDKIMVHDGILYSSMSRYWDGESWYGMGEDLTGSPFIPHVQGLAYFNGNVYFGGGFTHAGDVVANGIARWDGSAWHDLDGGVHQGTASGWVGGVASDAEFLWVAGGFDRAGDVNSPYFAKWDGENWHPVPTPGLHGQVDVRSSVVVDGKWYVVGGFILDTAEGIARNIAMWDGSEWHSFHGGTDDMVLDVSVAGSDVYVCGLFTSAGGVSAPHIARWDGSSWSSVGSGLSAAPRFPFTGWSGWEFAIAATEAGEVWVGGDHTLAGGIPSKYIGRFYDPVPFPSHGLPIPRSADREVDADLSWDTGGRPSEGVTYDVYFGTASDPPLFAPDHPSTSVVLDSLEFATRYYWRVVAKNAAGDHAHGPLWWFDTEDFKSSRLVVSSAATSCALQTGGTVEIDLSIEDAPVPIYSGGVELVYDPAVLTLLYCQPGDLTEAWQQFGSADLGGRVRIGGYNHDPIPAGSSGVFARVGFMTNCCGLDSARTVSLVAENLADDLAPLKPVRGEYVCEPANTKGDTNGDGAITVGDAYCTFQSYLFAPESAPTGCAMEVPPDQIDVDCSGAVTPSDALCIFRHWLDGSCVFCENTTGIASTGATRAADAPPVVVVGDVDVEEGVITVPVRVMGLPEIDAFGFEVDYSAERLEFLDAVWMGPFDTFEQLGVVEGAAGRLRLGGYTPQAADAVDADVVGLRFRVIPGSGSASIVIEGFVDDLEGAQVVDVPLGIGPGTPRYTRYVLDQNHPNPFNPVTIIHYEIPDAAGNVHVTLAVYDVAGRLVRALVNGPVETGPHDVEWDATNAFGERVSSGVYFYVMRAEGVQLAKKMVVLE